MLKTPYKNYGTISDINGKAELIIKDKNPMIELTVMESQVSFERTHPTDAIFLT